MSDRPSDGFTFDELREEYDWMSDFNDRMAKHCGTKDCPSLVAYVNKLESENAKLRELAAGVGHLLFSLDVDYCASCPKDSINHPCPVYTVGGGECLYKTDMRELGVEVDG